jgi:hypothetical protein
MKRVYVNWLDEESKSFFCPSCKDFSWSSSFFPSRLPHCAYQDWSFFLAKREMSAQKLRRPKSHTTINLWFLKVLLKFFKFPSAASYHYCAAWIIFGQIFTIQVIWNTNIKIYTSYKPSQTISILQCYQSTPFAIIMGAMDSWSGPACLMLFWCGLGTHEMTVGLAGRRDVLKPLHHAVTRFVTKSSWTSLVDDLDRRGTWKIMGRNLHFFVTSKDEWPHRQESQVPFLISAENW